MALQASDHEGGEFPRWSSAGVWVIASVGEEEEVAGVRKEAPRKICLVSSAPCAISRLNRGGAPISPSGEQSRERGGDPEMASTACFVIVSKNDIPIYEAEVGSAPKREDQAYQHQFILHAALDVVQDLAWATNTIFMLLHDSRSEDGIKSFFQEVHELYIKIFLNPLYLPGSRITSSHFDTKVRALARKYL
uniref:Trafficking protein particle complex subunit n=3 Tax=Oryza TaxID=4527 RepID=A0A0D9YUW6_9ORYZ